MSRVLLIVISLNLLVSTGCTVLDELDTAKSMMPATKANPVVEEVDSVSLATQAMETKDELIKQSMQLWEKAKSLSSTEEKTSIVSCRLDGSTQFMSEGDCLIRGGVLKSASG